VHAVNAEYGENAPNWNLSGTRFWGLLSSHPSLGSLVKWIGSECTDQNFGLSLRNRRQETWRLLVTDAMTIGVWSFSRRGRYIRREARFSFRIRLKVGWAVP